MWLNTCANNPTVDFLIYTDNKGNFLYPDNVKVHEISFTEIKSRIQILFDFQIALEKPYKLCDFRPAYGEIFSEDIKEYDFWGHCDIDLFWGDIRQFITDDILDRYDRVLTRGHCGLYRNTEEVNSWYKTLPSCGYQGYKDVFQSMESRCFDE